LWRTRDSPKDETGLVTAQNVFSSRGIVARVANEQTLYHIKDAHGDVIGLWDEFNRPLDSISYDPYGNQLSTELSVWDGNMLQVLQRKEEGVSSPFGYCGEYTDAETGFVYLRARYYDTQVGRFTQEDPIAAGLNWYAYCGNNPIMNVDPDGLDSYVLYDANKLSNNTFVTKEKAELIAAELKKLYGTTCHLIPVSSGQDIIDRWNGVDSYGLGFNSKKKEVSIDAVVIYAHASGTGYNFTGKDGNLNNQRFLVEDIGKLKQQDMKVLVSLGCNTGNSTIDKNLATEFMRQQLGIKNVIAADGNVSIGTKTTGHLFWKKTTVQISTAQGTREGSLDGFKLYSRDSNGNLVITPFGGFGNTFNGITDLIKSAKIK